jgi:hypothetical protein
VRSDHKPLQDQGEGIIPVTESAAAARVWMTRRRHCWYAAAVWLYDCTPLVAGDSRAEHIACFAKRDAMSELGRGGWKEEGESMENVRRSVGGLNS